MDDSEFHRLKRLPPYVFAEVNAMKARARTAGQDVIDLGIQISPRVLAAASAVYRDNLMPLQGRPLLYDPQTKSF